MLTNQQNRIFDDLITAERNLRTSAENNSRRLLALLPEIAAHLDGTRYEEMRKQDPSIPGRWSSDDWRNFFISIPTKPLNKSSWGAEKDNSENIAPDQKIIQQIAQLTAALAAEK